MYNRNIKSVRSAKGNRVKSFTSFWVSGLRMDMETLEDGSNVLKIRVCYKKPGEGPSEDVFEVVSESVDGGTGSGLFFKLTNSE